MDFDPLLISGLFLGRREKGQSNERNASEKSLSETVKRKAKQEMEGVKKDTREAGQEVAESAREFPKKARKELKDSFKEAWKELKVGCFFEVEQAPTLDPETMDWIDLAHARKVTFVSHLGGPELFGRKMWTESKRRHWHKAIDTQVVGDGAVWIWNLVADYFYDAHQVVDWYHATEHLAIAAHLAFGEGTPEAARWFRQQETPLFQGHADRVAQTILALADHHPTAKEKLQEQAG